MKAFQYGFFLFLILFLFLTKLSENVAWFMLTLLPANAIYILFLFAVNSNANTCVNIFGLKFIAESQEKKGMKIWQTLQIMSVNWTEETLIIFDMILI